MENKQSLIERLHLFARALRTQWKLSASVGALVLIVGTVFVMRLPNIYTAETRILVNPQKVSDQYVSSAVSMNSTERLNTLGQQILSSTRLQSIIEELHLFPKLQGKMGREQIVDLMRSKISIDLKQSSDGPSSFRLSYTGESPAEVAAVTNHLAESFVQWNLHDREQEAQGTTAFLNEQLRTTKAQLDDLEARLRSYKMQHLGQLPDQLQANLQALSRLQLELQANLDAQNRIDHESFLARTAVTQPLVPGVVPAESGLSPAQQLAVRDTQLHRELDELEQRYTARHPDVLAKQAEVREADAQLARVTAHESGQAPRAATGDTASPDSRIVLTPQMQLLARDRTRLQTEQRRIEGELAQYQAEVNATPVREQEMAQLLRDYDTAKEHYRSLLEKSYSAQMAAQLEHEQQGGSFTILDPAQVPDAPVGPKRPALLFGVLLLALGSALAMALIREALDTTIKSEHDLRGRVQGLTVLGFVPNVSVSRWVVFPAASAASNQRSQS